mmetsp:Transcript_2044/g.7920  ORF Transcript_2044/g.7920 Transcript_2044/m.7920 type:complete len:321 (+) Transcript_2044:913-1875(+)
MCSSICCWLGSSWSSASTRWATAPTSCSARCGSVVTLFWAFLVMFIIMYCVCVLIINGIVGDALDSVGGRRLSPNIFSVPVDTDTWQELDLYYGSFGKACLTMFRGISGGGDWSIFAMPLVQLSWWYGFLWVFYIGFMLYGVLNILTGIFVDTAMKAAEADCSIAVQEQMQKEEELRQIVRSVFWHLDEDSSGELTKNEFSNLLGNTRIVAHLRSIGIEAGKAEGLFDLLDEDKSGLLTIEEVVEGFVDIQGEAKAMDTLTLKQEMKKLHKSVEALLTSQGLSPVPGPRHFRGSMDPASNPHGSESNSQEERDPPGSLEL